MNEAATYPVRKLRRYYRYHSVIYDWTRPGFLFGRKNLVSKLPDLPKNPVIREVGCGTGINLLRLRARYPGAALHGIDLSPEMMDRARKRTRDWPGLELTTGVYGTGKPEHRETVDLILLSYTLAMDGVHPDRLLRHASEELKSGGYIAVVDFHDTPFGWFRYWMKQNHANIRGTLPSLLGKYFKRTYFDKKQAYWGLWSYFQYIGQKL